MPFTVINASGAPKGAGTSGVPWGNEKKFVGRTRGGSCPRRTPPGNPLRGYGCPKNRHTRVLILEHQQKRSAAFSATIFASTKIFWPKFFRPKIYFGQKFFASKFFAKIFAVAATAGMTVFRTPVSAKRVVGAGPGLPPPIRLTIFFSYAHL